MNSSHHRQRKYSSKNYFLAFLIITSFVVILLFDSMLMLKTNSNGNSVEGKIYKIQTSFICVEKVYVLYYLNNNEHSRSIRLFNPRKKIELNQTVTLRVNDFPRMVVIVDYYVSQLIVAISYIILGILLMIYMICDFLWKIIKRKKHYKEESCNEII
ncbi:MAG TPA: hypothetical protein PLH82_03425 [Candidatus Paceibacterota bacterium]|jgi:uncharacterized protein YoxC|nr:hypothetical protein [Candidatus Paceibacterota bacterium]